MTTDSCLSKSVVKSLSGCQASSPNGRRAVDGKWARLCVTISLAGEVAAAAMT